MIIYTGCKNQVEHQLKCDHKWHGPNMTFVGRYMLCSKCKCRDYIEIKSQRVYEARLRQMEKECGVESKSLCVSEIEGATRIDKPPPKLSEATRKKVKPKGRLP